MIHRNKAEIPRKNGKRFILRRSRKLRKLGQASLLLGEPCHLWGGSSQRRANLAQTLGTLPPSLGGCAKSGAGLAQTLCGSCRMLGRATPFLGYLPPKIANAAQSLGGVAPSFGRFPSLKRRGGCASNKKSRSHRRAAQTGWSIRRGSAIGEYGNMGIRNIQLPGSIRIDMGLTRKFRIREKQTVEFRAEAFNLPNHLNPGNPNTTLSNLNFGKDPVVAG